MKKDSNLMSGKRPNRGISKYANCKTPVERLEREAKGLREYQARVGQLPK